MGNAKRRGGRKYVLGVDIGGTKCAVVLGDSKMRVHDRLAFPTLARHGVPQTLRRLFAAIDEILDRNHLTSRSLKTAGVACGGPLDTQKGLVLSPFNLPGWDRIPITRLLNKKLRCPVRLENDANACAVAEWKFGAGRGCRNLVFLTLGTGLGMGLILSGRLYRGTNDMAGEAGHWRMAPDGPLGYGKKGSFEGFCSGQGLARLSKAKGLKGYSAKDVFKGAARGAKGPRRILQESAGYLGMGLSMIIDLLNPERIILGGIYARNERLLRPGVLKVIQKEALARSQSVCRIVPSGLGERVGDMACLCVALMEDRKAI